MQVPEVVFPIIIVAGIAFIIWTAIAEARKSQGTGPSSDPIPQLVKRMMGSAIGSTKTLVPLDHDSGFSILLQFIFLNYHWIDRLAYQQIGSRRDEFMDHLRSNLLKEIELSLYSDRMHSDRAQALKAIDEALDEFQQAYGSYAAAPSGESGPAGTLFYEFGKNVAKLLGRGSDPFTAMKAAAAAMDGSKVMEVAKLLRGLA